jgi:hypothetical protein
MRRDGVRSGASARMCTRFNPDSIAPSSPGLRRRLNHQPRRGCAPGILTGPDPNVSAGRGDETHPIGTGAHLDTATNQATRRVARQ